MDQELAHEEEAEGGAKWPLLRVGGYTLWCPLRHCTGATAIINDLNEAAPADEIIRKFADDTKVGNGVETAERHVQLQQPV